MAKSVQAVNCHVVQLLKNWIFEYIIFDICKSTFWTLFFCKYYIKNVYFHVLKNFHAGFFLSVKNI